MSIEATEAESAAVAKAPTERVSLDSMKAKIRARYDLTGDRAVAMCGENPDGALHLLSLCILVMESGFVIVGKSAPASAANFNRELGKKFAYEDAIRQLWPLEGYALREKLAA